MSPQHIVLIGLSGSGKSTVAPLLADALGLTARDLDREIEAQTGLSIADTFVRHGERYFRDLESRALAGALADPPAVVAAGGGAVLSPANRTLLFGRTVTVWLRAKPALLAERLAASPSEVRPLAVGDLRGRLEAMSLQREPYYALADIVVDTDTLSPEETARTIVSRLVALSERPPH